ncbi:hypothetical protein MMC26_003408 [Xylographa opegraphella]|nr:hypothetical protein [Xylographa opegraphella]
MSSSILSLLTLLLLCPTLNSAISTGSVTVFADAGCQDPVFANNYTVAPDICGSPGPVVSFNGGYNSFIVDSRPMCANGTRGSFALYSDTNCKTLYQAHPADQTIEGTGTSLDGICLGMVEYLSVAFLCDGIPQGTASSSINTLPTVAPLLSATTSMPVARVYTSIVTMTPAPLPPTVLVITSTAPQNAGSAGFSAGFSAGAPSANATIVSSATLSASVAGTAPLSVATNTAGALRVGVEMGLVVLLGLLLRQ